MGRLLVVGSTGLLGSEFVRQQQLLKTVFPTVLFSIRNGDLETNQHPFVFLNFLDIERLRETLDALAPTTIINCAAMTSVETCESNPTSAQHLNATIPSALASWTRGHHAKLVHYSTAAVFDGEKVGYRESDKPRPLNRYAKTKYLGDQEVFKENDRALVLRIELTGFRGKPPYPLAEKIIRSVSQSRVFDGFTDMTFAPLTPKRVVEFTLLALQHHLVGLYNVDGAGCMSKYDFAVRLATACGYPPDLIREAMSASSGLIPRPRSTCLASDRFFRKIQSRQPTIDEVIQELAGDSRRVPS